jgi:hypothetical protein
MGSQFDLEGLRRAIALLEAVKKMTSHLSVLATAEHAWKWQTADTPKPQHN